MGQKYLQLSLEERCSITSWQATAINQLKSLSAMARRRPTVKKNFQAVTQSTRGWLQKRPCNKEYAAAAPSIASLSRTTALVQTRIASVQGRSAW